MRFAARAHTDAAILRLMHKVQNARLLRQQVRRGADLGERSDYITNL